MNGLVLELQRDALNKNIAVSDLLRKALVVSKKLLITEIEEWINRELNGYSTDEETIPEYREIKGVIKVLNPYHGWQPLNFGDHKMAVSLSKRKISQAISELDSIAQNKSNKNLQIPFPPHIVNMLMKGMEIPLQPTLLVSQTSVIGLLDSVRNEILNWSLELESKGIIGNGMSFTKEEKKTATNTTYQITNNIGNMSNSQIQQDSSNASQKLAVNHNINDIYAFLSELKEKSNDLKLSKDNKNELEAEIATLENQIKSPKPKPVIITESLKSVRSILEGITGSVIAAGLLYKLSSLM